MAYKTRPQSKKMANKKVVHPLMGVEGSSVSITIATGGCVVLRRHLNASPFVPSPSSCSTSTMMLGGYKSGRSYAHRCAGQQGPRRTRGCSTRASHCLGAKTDVEGFAEYHCGAQPQEPLSSNLALSGTIIIAFDRN